MAAGAGAGSVELRRRRPPPPLRLRSGEGRGGEVERLIVRGGERKSKTRVSVFWTPTVLMDLELTRLIVVLGARRQLLSNACYRTTGSTLYTHE